MDIFLDLTPSSRLPHRCENQDPGQSWEHIGLEAWASVPSMHSRSLCGMMCVQACKRALCGRCQVRGCSGHKSHGDWWEDFLNFLSGEQRRCDLLPESFVPGAPPPNFYPILWENIPGDSATSSGFVLEKMLYLVRKPHLEFCLYCLVKIIYCYCFLFSNNAEILPGTATGGRAYLSKNGVFRSTV